MNETKRAEGWNAEIRGTRNLPLSRASFPRHFAFEDVRAADTGWRGEGEGRGEEGSGRRGGDNAGRESVHGTRLRAQARETTGGRSDGRSAGRGARHGSTV